MANNSSDEWNPVEDRRKFLATVGTAGAASVAGCPSFGGSGGGNSGGGGDGDDDGGVDTTSISDVSVDPEANDQIPAAQRNFALPVDGVDTTFDAAVDEGTTTVIDSDRMDAVVDADTDAHEYVFDEAALDGELESGDVVLVSGVALRKVTRVKRTGTEATVETEQATLDEAIAEGTVGWDSELGAELAYSPDDKNRRVIDDEESSLDGAPRAPGGVDGNAFFTGVEMVGPEGTEAVPLAQMDTDGTTLEWVYTQGDREYTFRVEQGTDQATIRVQVKQPAEGNANLALTAEGTVGSMRSVASAEYSDHELREFELNQNNVAADIEVSMAAAGAADGTIDWEFPGVLFKYVIFAGPVPVTLSFNTKLIGNITVPSVEGSATGTARFDYRADTGFSYSGSDVTTNATVGDQPLQPESSDAAANIGSPVDLQFGVAYPRLEISVFDQVMIPYVEFGMTVGSRLEWGPLCKSGYVRMVINAGYDFEILGVSLASDKVQLFEDTERSYGEDGCPDK